MNWNEYVNSLLLEYDFNERLNNIEVVFSDAHNRIEPSLFTRFNSYFVKSLEINEKKRLGIIYPNDSKFLGSLIIYKTLYELYNEDTLTLFNPADYKKGDILCFGKAVFKVSDLTPSYAMFEFKSGKISGRTYDKLPFLSKAKSGADIGTENTFNDEMAKYNAIDSSTVIGKLMKVKNLRNNTVLIVGPVQKYVSMFKQCTIDNAQLIDLINVGKVDRGGNISPVGGNFSNYHFIICPELYLAQFILEQNNYPIESVLVDTCDRNNIDDSLDIINDIAQKNVETIFFVQENSSFDYIPLVNRQFVFFQWKKGYLFDNEFGNNQISESLNCFRNRNVEFLSFNDNGLSDLYYQFLDLRDDVAEMPSLAINAYVAFFNSIKDECTKYCHVIANDDDVINKMLSLEQHCKNLKSIRNEIIGDHPIIDAAQNAYNFIFNFLSLENEKIQYIWNDITNIDNYEDKIAIVISDTTNTDDVAKYLSIRMANSGYNHLYFDVVNVSDFQFSKWHYRKAIFVGWFRKEIMKTALLSNNSDLNTILLYKCEKPWVKSALSVWNAYSIHNDFSNINYEIQDDYDEPVLEYVCDDNTQQINDDLDTTSKEQSKLFVKGLLKDNSDTEFVMARPITFSNGSYAFFPVNKTLASASLLISGDSDDLESVLVSNIKPGDVLVIKDNSSSDVLEELANKLLNNDDVLSRSKCWKEAIEQKMTMFGLTTNEMVQEIINAGCKRNESTVRSWITNQSIISPMYIEDLQCIAIATEDSILLEECNEVFNACKKVKASRISAGFRLSETIMNSPEIIKAIQLYAEKGVLNIKDQTINIDDVGTASILKVIEVGEVQEFPKVLCNKRRMN